MDTISTGPRSETKLSCSSCGADMSSAVSTCPSCGVPLVISESVTVFVEPLPAAEGQMF